MGNAHALYEYIGNLTAVNCHIHHMRDWEFDRLRQSDARTMMDKVLAKVLEDKVDDAYITMSDAKALAERIMYKNGKQLFNL